ncbi:hypothetical protein [Andreprevotia chitinilytica]|uniref:hypothetical protein n=1 Tax=Andreprevotia chitinilytica TaxID=396808 RepID=UPI00054F654F|nr:hypothetical protein [Andreprevotia chitinilytica]
MSLMLTHSGQSFDSLRPQSGQTGINGQVARITMPLFPSAAVLDVTRERDLRAQDMALMIANAPRLARRRQARHELEDRRKDRAANDEVWQRPRHTLRESL